LIQDNWALIQTAGKKNEANVMRVMVSLNLADIMTATRPAMAQHVYETPNNEAADPADSSQESQLPGNSELSDVSTSNPEL
jgi:uncharacterized membrane protein YdbT with pleckstrin-like domain